MDSIFVHSSLVLVSYSSFIDSYMELENSNISSLYQPISSNYGGDSFDGCEESGWTDYLEDFDSTHNKEQSGDGISSISSTFVPDAVSCADFKRVSKNLSFKKRRTNGVADGVDDEALQDTASSPVNSPKIGQLRLRDMKLSKEDGKNHNFQSGGSTSLVQFSGLQQQQQQPIVEGRNKLGSVRKENECTTTPTDLKKRGLCLVPLSLLVPYLA